MKKIIFIWLLCSSVYSQSRYEIRCPQILIDRSYQYLIGEVGKKETGNNRGIADYYNSAIGNPLGSAYCQAGQYWCYYMAAKDYNLPLKLLPVPRNGLAISTYSFAKKSGVKTSYKAKKNDFIVWQSKYNNTGHIERIILVKKAGWVETVGFNTGVQSQDNGEGVARKLRNIMFPLNRIKYIKGLVGVKGNEIR